MRAVVFRKPRELTIETVADPELERATDALIRLTSSAICGTDLHIYEGRMGEPTGMVIGHEPLGVVEEVGSAVVSVKPGDRVTVPTHICCGFCASCVSGRSAECLMTNPEVSAAPDGGASARQAGAAYGYRNMGDYKGAQAELLRVPFADANCLRLPGEPGDDWEDDFVLLTDEFPSGYHATVLAGVSPGDSVAVFGAGAIGLLAAYSARLRGAADIYVVDNIPERLDKAGEMGFEPIDFGAGDPVEQILEARRRMRNGSVAWRGEEPLIGVTIGMGRDHDERYNGRLRDLIVTGQARPSTIVSHHIGIDEAPDAYRHFDARQDGYLKVVLRPG